MTQISFLAALSLSALLPVLAQAEPLRGVDDIDLTAGQSITYFSTPWGLQMEAISYPEGMAYQATAQTTLWTNRATSQ
ncbi:hypothetical protein FHS72_001127 [Loktanella ponticola]|uniref:Uncharacterized protein n=1 Tax=Yoonia ponticola TaxID=1524255 RepID=A0A7W9BJ88_9RHOB|nr:hypothetical protein [Yoonia ponticola]MBB5721515.1 hypothetical protein [Yoonia ponticola]